MTWGSFARNDKQCETKPWRSQNAINQREQKFQTIKWKQLYEHKKVVMKIFLCIVEP